MKPALLRRRIAERGGLCEMWLVYEENRQETEATGEFRVRLMRAFWSRAEAAGWAFDDAGERPQLSIGTNFNFCHAAAVKRGRN